MRLTTCCHVSMAVIMLGVCSANGSLVEWSIDRGDNGHFYEASEDFTEVKSYVVECVPEPATVVLVGLGAVRV